MKTTTITKGLFFCAALISAPLPGRAATLNWNTISGTGADWVAGSLNGSFDVDGANPGNDISITITQNNGSTFTTAFPQNVQFGPSTIGNNDQHYLQIRTPSFIDPTRSFTVTINFNYVGGVYASLALIDVDTQVGPPSWTDQITNISGNGGTVPMNVSAGPADIVSGSGLGVTVTGDAAAGNILDHSGDVSISSGATKVSSISFTYGTPGPNFDGQVISLSNIVFFTTPEVGCSLGALAFCTGLATFTRRRRTAAS